jgi:hypothetical protein
MMTYGTHPVAAFMHPACDSFLPLIYVTGCRERKREYDPQGTTAALGERGTYRKKRHGHCFTERRDEVG